MLRLDVLVVSFALFGIGGAACTTRPQDFNAPPDCAAPMPPERRIIAMLSVRAHAYAAIGELPEGQTPESLGLPALDVAIQTLRDDCDQLASSRRRRAAAKLAAYGRHAPEMNSTWERLVDDPHLKADVRSFLEAPPTESLPTLEVESSAFDLLAGLTAATGCITKEPDFSGPDFNKDGGFVSWQIALTVNRADDLLPERLDPQNWSRCNALFANTFYTKQVPTRVSSCGSGPGPTPAHNDPKTPGTGYQAMLFEHFRCTDCKSELQNLLRITATRDGGSCANANPCADRSSGTVPTPAFQVCYDLRAQPTTPCGDPPKGTPACPSDAIFGCIGDPPRHVDLLVDQGSISACRFETGEELRVISRKVIKFTDSFDNLKSWTLFWLTKQEATDMLTEMVCC